MSNVETYLQNEEIASFLKKELNVKYGSRDDNALKGLYESLVFYENGHTYMHGPAKHKARVKRLLKYFDKAIDKLSKKNRRVALNAAYLKERINYIDTSRGVLSLYYDIKGMID